MENVLELKNITKVYPGVVALDRVSMSFLPIAIGNPLMLSPDFPPL